MSLFKESLEIFSKRQNEFGYGFLTNRISCDVTNLSEELHKTYLINVDNTSIEYITGIEVPYVNYTCQDYEYKPQTSIYLLIKSLLTTLQKVCGAPHTTWNILSYEKKQKIFNNFHIELNLILDKGLLETTNNDNYGEHEVLLKKDLQSFCECMSNYIKDNECDDIYNLDKIQSKEIGTFVFEGDIFHNEIDLFNYYKDMVIRRVKFLYREVNSLNILHCIIKKLKDLNLDSINTKYNNILNTVLYQIYNNIIEDFFEKVISRKRLLYAMLILLTRRLVKIEYKYYNIDLIDYYNYINRVHFELFKVLFDPFNNLTNKAHCDFGSYLLMNKYNH